MTKPIENMIAECPAEHWPQGDMPDNMFRSKKSDMLQVRAQCRQLTGSDTMPPILYKGRLIPAGTLGTRKLAFGR